MKYSKLITMIAFCLLLINSVLFSDNITHQGDTTEKKIISNNSLKIDTAHTGIGFSRRNSSSLLPDSVHSNHTAKDSLKQRSIFESILHSEQKRRAMFIYDSTPDFKNPYLITTPELYRKDATSMAEALQYHPLLSSLKFGLSNSLNCYLPYGSVAPVTDLWTGTIINKKLPQPLFPVSLDHQFSTETEAIAIQNDGIHLLDYPTALPSPETVLLWENGVFDESLLDVRFSRPLSRNIMLSVFSNYRHFNGTEFSHEGGNVYSTYANLYRDSTNVSHNGYNPQTDEHASGAQLTYKGFRGNSLHFEMRYSDLLNEIALDNTSMKDKVIFEKLYRYPLSFEFISSSNNYGKFFWDLGLSYLNEPTYKVTPTVTNNITTLIRNDAGFKNFSANIRTGITTGKSDSIGISIASSLPNAHQYSGSDSKSTIIDTRIFYTINFHKDPVDLHVNLNGGINRGSNDDSSALYPAWHAGLDLIGKTQNVRAYVQQENIPYAVPFDSVNYKTPLLDNYFMGGLEYSLHSSKAELLLGYQFLSGIDSLATKNAWPGGILPYEQPRSVVVVSPRLGRWRGLSLSGSGFFSDRKPYVKAQSNLSYVFHPLSTSEFIDLNLGIVYWSERDPITFAGMNDWNKSFCNVDFGIAVHILSFRLFYKVDNILNRKFAYVPGYYSPGLTFRWGFNWFIQR